MRGILVAIMLFMPSAGWGQWQILDGHTTADLRGVDNVGKGVVWVSGTNGTVLRSEDDGYMWQGCTVPPGAEKLDFRGIQAFDANVAIVMSSGPGEASRLYKTTDGCQSWKLLFVNPDKDGFWDALLLNRFDKDGMLLGDPVRGKFAIWQTEDKGMTWQRMELPGQEALPGESVFAASNSSMTDDEAVSFRFGTGGISGARVLISGDLTTIKRFRSVPVPMSGKAESSGIFSIDFRPYDAGPGKTHDCCIDDDRWVVVGGDYKQPTDSQGTAAYTIDGGNHWHPAKVFPHGYRSAVAYDEKSFTWITVGPDGTDVSVDDGRDWRALKPDMRIPGAQVDEDRRWNALSLPFVVGPGGRIGMLRPEALKGR